MALMAVAGGTRWGCRQNKNIRITLPERVIKSLTFPLTGVGIRLVALCVPGRMSHRGLEVETWAHPGVELPVAKVVAGPVHEGHSVSVRLGHDFLLLKRRPETGVVGVIVTDHTAGPHA